MANKTVKYPCKGCVYFNTCGESTRTAPCEGRKTKREVKRAKDFLHCELQDDNKSEYGGIGHVGETLEEFIAEVGLSADTAMRHVNVALKQCGIEPIPYN